MIWKYRIDVREEATISGESIGIPEFRGIASMSDGSVYLCGSTPRAGRRRSGLLTHLDPQGHVLNEKLMVPHNMTPNGLVYLHDCLPFGGGLAIIGSIADGQQYLYWLLLLDAAGQVQRDVQFPTLDGRMAGLGTTLMVVGSNLVFSSYTGLNTEVVRLTSSGEIQARKLWRLGAFELVRSVTADTTVQLIGMLLEPHGHGTMTILTLNERLEEESRVEGRQSTYGAEVAYRLPDHSFILFSAKNDKANIVVADEHLQSQRRLALPRRKLSSVGRIEAVVPVPKRRTFVVATLGIADGVKDPEQEGFGALPNFRRGTVLDFVQLQDSETSTGSQVAGTQDPTSARLRRGNLARQYMELRAGLFARIVDSIPQFLRRPHGTEVEKQARAQAQDVLIERLARELTESDLRRLVDFYGSPVGRRYSEIETQMAEVAKAGRQRRAEAPKALDLKNAELREILGLFDEQYRVRMALIDPGPGKDTSILLTTRLRLAMLIQMQFQELRTIWYHLTEEDRTAILAFRDSDVGQTEREALSEAAKDLHGLIDQLNVESPRAPS